MYRFCKLKKCASHELMLIWTDDSANHGQVLGGAVSSFCAVRAGTFGMQPEIEAAAHQVWVMFGHVASERAGPNPTSWLKQHINVRLDRPGTARPRRSIYASGNITVWGPATQELSTAGYLGQSFRDYLLSEFMLKWREEIEIEGLDLRPVLPNTRVWIAGQSSKQWSYTPQGKIVEIDNTTLPEPEEHFINYFHLIPPPAPDPDEEAELDELMAMTLEERVAHLLAIAQEAKRRKRAERGE
jgi:hypothetical protein